MRAFLKSLDERVWQIVVNGWSVPSTTIDGVVTPTPIENWSRAQLDSYNLNSKALHALFMAVSPEEFRRVSMCEVAKEVWDILETTHEETQAVNSSKLQMLATGFEEIRMRDDEMFDIFYASLNDIVNSSFNLGEKISEPKIVRKILRSLPERFRPKVTTIEESKDIDTIKVEELVGSLQTYELTLDNPAKEKSTALKSARNIRMEYSYSDSPNDEEMAYLTKKFQKMFRNRKKLQERQRGDRSESRKNSKSVRCHNCHGFVHSEKSTREESEKYVAFVARGKSGSDKGSERTEDLDSSEDSGDKSGSVEDLETAYDMMYEESFKILATSQAMSKKVKELKLGKEQLEACVSDLTSKNEMSSRRVKHLESELELSRFQLLAFSSSSERLDNILGMGKPTGDKGGLGFDLNVVSTSQTTFVCATNQPNIVTNPIPNVVGTSGRRSTRRRRTRRPRNRNQRKHITGPRFIPIRFHCGELGHIRPKYHHYLNNRKDLSLKKNKNQVSVGQIGFLTDQVNHLTQLMTQLSGNNPPSRQAWVKKSNLSNLVRDRGASKGKITYIPT
ncbi:uncharacterized protein LOC111400347 [Olea europaea var. sylvestris]|uniref:uncharacterized protein LOC111400347 n=1 Tax=Olea europaea var. sylvestris TaxID=158386 RepID=UPI000C1D57AE|nr:uncharacterized protein LOC111400347 [Olea europaea var. sylvestris]